MFGFVFSTILRARNVSVQSDNTVSWKYMLPDGKNYVTVGGFFAMEIRSSTWPFFVIWLYTACCSFLIQWPPSAVTE
jgi:hypothetical protein